MRLDSREMASRRPECPPDYTRLRPRRAARRPGLEKPWRGRLMKMFVGCSRRRLAIRFDRERSLYDATAALTDCLPGVLLATQPTEAGQYQHPRTQHRQGGGLRHGDQVVADDVERDPFGRSRRDVRLCA